MVIMASYFLYKDEGWRMQDGGTIAMTKFVLFQEYLSWLALFLINGI